MIENIASICFDFNPPVITEPSVLVAEFSTGVGEAGGHDLLVFPNPGQDRFAVQFAGAFSVRVADLLGRAVLRSVWANDRLEMDASALRPGAYVVKVVSSTEETFQRPWLKN